MKGWHPSVCTKKYEEIASVIFRKGWLHRIPLVSMMLSLWHWPVYSGSTLQRVIEHTYGDETMMLDTSYASSIGARIILPAARSPEPSVFLFTNYKEGSSTDDPLQSCKSSSYEMHENASNITISDV